MRVSCLVRSCFPPGRGFFVVLLVLSACSEGDTPSGSGDDASMGDVNTSELPTSADMTDPDTAADALHQDTSDASADVSDEPDGSCSDDDGDGVCNEEDICEGGDDNEDADEDGVPDFCDVCEEADDNEDADEDGVPDACDICPIGDDTVDTDEDGVPDDCDCDDAGDDCHANAYCVPADEAIECHCLEGYEGDGVTTCDNINECAAPTSPCAANAACSDNDGGFICDCNVGTFGYAYAAGSCYPCDSSCADCTSTGPTGCSECANGNWDADSGDAFNCTLCSVCTGSTYLSEACTATANTTCSACNAGCSTCNGVTSTDCLSCGSNEHLNGSACVCDLGYVDSDVGDDVVCDQCDVGYFDSDPRVEVADCDACNAGCQTCETTPTTCLSCGSNEHLDSSACVCDLGYVDSDEGYDVVCDQCEAGYFDSDPRVEVVDCDTCDAGCQTCETTATTCLSCGSNEHLDSSACVCDLGYVDSDVGCDVVCDQCEVGYFDSDPNVEVVDCDACNAGCQTCETTPTTCLSCGSNEYLDSSTCVCDVGYVDSDDGDDVVCDECDVGYVDSDEGDDVVCDQCDSGYYDSDIGAPVICSACNTGCQTCETTPTTCLSCGSNEYLDSSTCVCDVGYVDSDVGDDVVCDQCDSGYFDSDPSVEIVDCDACDLSCTTCDATGPTGCTACASGYGDADPSSDFNCLRDCGTPSAPTGGHVAAPGGTLETAVATYSCNPGLSLSGTETRTCQSDGAWSGTAATCEFDAANNYVFVTADPHDGNFGGLAGADAFCQSQADSVSLPGTYLAYLHVIGANANDRFVGSGGWYRVDGWPFANTLADAVGGQMFYPPLIDQNGAAIVGSQIWTGASSIDGTDCSTWTSTTGQAFRGIAYHATYWDVSTGEADCTSEKPILCLRNNALTADVTPTGLDARLAFVSTTKVSGDGGSEAMHTACQDDFEDVFGTETGRIFRAFVANGSESAVDQLADQTSATWARPDGVILAETTADLFAWDLMAHFTVEAGGDFNFGYVWTGATSPTGSATSDCGGWTDDKVSGRATRGYDLTLTFGFYSRACTGSYEVLCLEDFTTE